MGFPKFISRFWSVERASSNEFDEKRRKLLRRTPPPVFWLFGKAGSGKSSIVAFLTGAEDVQIGRGFRATTRQTYEYGFPDPSMPLMSFLDTRGLGEVGYDVDEDLNELKDRSHAMIVTQRVLDFAYEPVVDPLKKIRKAERNRPIILALTCLHQAYPRENHPPYPFRESLEPGGVGETLSRAISKHRKAFAGLCDKIVPIDLTNPEDQIRPVDYGGDHLRDTLVEVLPEAYQRSMAKATELITEWKDLLKRRAMSYVYSSAFAAAGAAATPIPVIDISIVAGIQTRMVYSIASVYDQAADAKQVVELLSAGSIGGGLSFAARMGIRSLAKVVPGVGTIGGGAICAALAFSYTYGLGKLACWYYDCILGGHKPTPKEIARQFGLDRKEGNDIWRKVKPKRGRS